jgi:hypothetical protein
LSEAAPDFLAAAMTPPRGEEPLPLPLPLLGAELPVALLSRQVSVVRRWHLRSSRYCPSAAAYEYLVAESAYPQLAPPPPPPPPKHVRARPAERSRAAV